MIQKILKLLKSLLTCLWESCSSGQGNSYETCVKIMMSMIICNFFEHSSIYILNIFTNWIFTQNKYKKTYRYIFFPFQEPNNFNSVQKIFFPFWKTTFMQAFMPASRSLLHWIILLPTQRQLVCYKCQEMGTGNWKGWVCEYFTTFWWSKQTIFYYQKIHRKKKFRNLRETYCGFFFPYKTSSLYI